MPSLNLTRFRIARRDGATIEAAAELSGLGLNEALSWAQDDAENPPPPEAYALPVPKAAGVMAASTENIMARKPATTTKAPDPFGAIADGLSEDLKAKKLAEAKTADTVAAGAIEGAGAALDAGGDARDVAAATIGGAAAATAEIEADNEPAREQVRVEAERPTKLETPAAPGDEPESVFDRRLARLTTLATEAQFETGTLFGDLRDLMLDQYKHQVKPWAQMKPSEKQAIVNQCESVAGIVVGKMVLVLAQEDSETVQGTLDKKWTVNGESIELKVKLAEVHNDTLIDVLKLAGQRVVLVSADSKRFMSARRSQDQGDDQVAMQFEATPKPEPKPETAPRAAEPLPGSEVSDAALADGDETESGVDRAIDNAVKDAIEESAISGTGAVVDKIFGVFDTTDAEWIKTVAVGNDTDEWTGDTAEALAMTSEEAGKLADEYGDGFEARRFDDEG